MKFVDQIIKRGFFYAIALSLSIAIVVMALPSAGWSQVPVKLGYIDMEKAVNDSDAGRDARNKFVRYMKQKKAESDKKKKELSSMKQILEKQGALLAEDVRVEKEQEYQRKVREYQLYLKNLRDDTRTKEMEMSKKIIRQIQKIIFSYAKREGYAMIFEKSRSGLLYAPDSLDLTDTIIKIFNQEYSKKK